MTLWKITVIPVEGSTVLAKIYHIEARFQNDAEEKAKTLWRDEQNPKVEAQEIQIDARVTE